MSLLEQHFFVQKHHTQEYLRKIRSFLQEAVLFLMLLLLQLGANEATTNNIISNSTGELRANTSSNPIKQFIYFGSNNDAIGHRTTID